MTVTSWSRRNPISARVCLFMTLMSSSLCDHKRYSQAAPQTRAEPTFPNQGCHVSFWD
jgi:hypothetical protein